jgi:hypothetical protein
MAWSKTKKAVVWGPLVALILVAAIVLFLQWHNIANWMMVTEAKHAVANHTAIPLDLTGKYAVRAENDGSGFWDGMPCEFQVFHHVPLQIDGMLYLWGKGNAKKGAVFPEQVLGIPVNETFQSLYVYHCTFYKSPRNTPVYNLVFRYADGDSATNTVLYGRDTMDFDEPGGTVAKSTYGKNSKVAWMESADMPPEGKRTLVYSLTAIKNPRPTEKVTSIDLFSCKRNSAGVVFAMTAGPSGMMK